MTEAQIMRQINPIKYSGAISHYNKLKRQFLQQYAQEAQITLKEAQEIFIDKVVDEVNSNPLYKQESLVNQLYDELEESIVNTLKGDKGNLRNFRNSLKQRYESNFNIDNKDMMYELEMVITEEQMAQMVKDSLRKGGYGDADAIGTSIDDILNQMKSFKTKVLQKRIVEGTGHKTASGYYRRSTKGYYREAMIHKAFYELTDTLEGKLGALHAGSIKIKGVDTEIDEYISFAKNLGESFLKQVTADVHLGYGAQSKSWTEPWIMGSGPQNETLKKHYWSIGSRANLYSAFKKKESWIASVRYLGQMQNTLAAMGQSNVFFITGKNFYWTADLISKFRENNYWLAFVFDSDLQATKKVSWQQIDYSMVD